MELSETKRFPARQAAEQTSRSSTPTSSSSTLNPSTPTLKTCLHSSAEFGEACECGAEESCGQQEPCFRFSSGTVQGFLALGLQKTRSDRFVDSQEHFLFLFFLGGTLAAGASHFFSLDLIRTYFIINISLGLQLPDGRIQSGTAERRPSRRVRRCDPTGCCVFSASSPPSDAEAASAASAHEATLCTPVPVIRWPCAGLFYVCVGPRARVRVRVCVFVCVCVYTQRVGNTPYDDAPPHKSKSRWRSGLAASANMFFSMPRPTPPLSLARFSKGKK